MTEGERRYRTAAWAYLGYAVVYYVGGLYLMTQGVGVMGSTGARATSSLAFWALAGLVPMLGIPALLYAPRGWFDRWVLSRRDFARVVALLLAFRAYKVGQVAVSGSGAAVAAPWGGTVSFRAGAAVFLVVTLVALIAIVRAAWARDAHA